jgi:hypothetical protein
MRTGNTGFHRSTGNDGQRVCYTTGMSKLLDDAIKKVRELPESDQDEAAEMLLSVASRKHQPIPLDPETRTAVEEGREQARRGEFVSDEDMAAFFARHGVNPRKA